MPRIRPLTTDEDPPEVRKIMEATERALGEALIALGVMAYSPSIFETSSVLGEAPARSHSLPAELRSLVCLQPPDWLAIQ